MGLFGGGHKGNSTTWDSSGGNDYVLKEIRANIQKYASGLGLTLDDATISNIADKVFPEGDRFTGDNTDGDRAAKLEEAKNFILPNLSQLKLNPTAGKDQVVQAGNAIRSVLGRDASEEEAAYFAKELAQGKSVYELQQELMSLPEYQKVQAAKDREVLGQELLAQQQLAFQKATPAIISQFMKAGRIGSSGLDSAMANAQKELEQQRQGYLGQVGYQDLASIRGNAYQNYNNYANQFKDAFGTVGQTSANYNLLGNAIKRMNEQSDYAKQRNDYMNYLNMQNRSNERAARYQMYGQIAGGGLGALAGMW